MSRDVHTPSMRLQAAQRDLEFARQACPHWDYEDDGAGSACCDDVEEAKRELRNARAALAKAGAL